MHTLRLSAVLLIASFMLYSSVYSSTHEFFKGNTVTLIAGTSPGSSIDVLARSVARVLSKHLGTRAIVVQNMPGAGGIVMTNHLAHRVKPDGATLGSYIGS